MATELGAQRIACCAARVRGRRHLRRRLVSLPSRGPRRMVSARARHPGARRRGVGLVITAYEQRTRPGQLHVSRSEDLTPARYQELRHL